MTNFYDLLSISIGTSLTNQYLLQDYLKERDWQLTLSRGTVIFGNEFEFPVQLLGSESNIQNNWLWIWANKKSPIPEDLTEYALKLKEYGKNKNIPELYNESIELGKINGHILSMAALEILNENCYYRGPYEGGAIFFIVKDVPNDVFDNLNPNTIIKVISEIISNYDIDHKIMVENLLKNKNYKLKWINDFDLLAQNNKNQEVQISFDKNQRVSKLNTELNN